MGSMSTNSSGGKSGVKTLLTKAYTTISEKGSSGSPDRRPVQRPETRRETLDTMKMRLRGSSTYWCRDTGEYEACDPWMFAYFGGLRRSVQGFELSEQYAGLTFGELVHAVFRDTEALVIGIFKGGRLLICPQQTHKNTLVAGQLCFAVAEKPEQLDPCRVKSRSQFDWRTRLMSMSEQLAMSVIQNGTHMEAVKLCAHQLQNTLVHHSASRWHADAEEDSRRFLSTMSTCQWPGHAHGEEEQTSQGSQVIPPSPMSVERQVSSEGNWSRRGSKDNFLTLPRPVERKVSEENSRQISPENKVSACDTDYSMSMRRPAGREGALVADDRDALMRVRDLRRTLGDYEELVVLVVCHGEVWQQVRTFVTCLRGSHLPVMQPVVVLVPCNPPPGLLEDCGSRVVMIKGNHLSARVLLNIGILEASAVVVMTGEGVSRGHFKEPIFKDYQVMLVAQELECWCGISEREVYTTYELQDSRSVRYLPFLICRSATQLEDVLEEAVREGASSRIVHAATVPEESDGSDLPGRAGRNSEQVFARVASESPGGNQDVTRGGYEESVLFHPRFAAGQVFTPEIWGAMLGRAFYNPAIIETVEALVMPHRRGQAAFPWQIRVPPAYVGHHYSELVKDMALGGWDKGAGKSQAPSEPGAPRRFSMAGLEDPPSSTSTNYIRQPLEGPAVPVALYRVRDDIAKNSFMDSTLAQGTGGHNYNILAPPPGTKLRAEDWVLVIGSHRFGRKVFNLGLLRGSSGRETLGHAGGRNSAGSAASSAGCQGPSQAPSCGLRRRTGVQGNGANHDGVRREASDGHDDWQRSVSEMSRPSVPEGEIVKQDTAGNFGIAELLRYVHPSSKLEKPCGDNAVPG